MSSATETDPERAPPPPRAEGAEGPVALRPIDPDAYELLGEVARGGMGRIVRARDRRLDRVVAIKQLIAPTPRLAALFEREIRLTARLQHPSIVSIYEAGTLPDGELVYAMRLVPGRALRDVLRAPRALPDRLALLPMVIAVADALAYAHQQRVVHRDLKPGNVLVGEFGEVVVIDWGLARDLDQPDAAVAVAPDGDGDVSDDDDDEGEGDGDRAGAATARPAFTAGVLGTPAYMAPEAARGEEVDARADVYAIGAILYEALTGAPPYDGRDGRAVRAAVRAGPPAALAARAPGVPADLAAIVDKAMARAPEARYPTARELAEELRRFQAGQLVSAHAYSWRERAARWLRRHRAPVAVAAVAGTVVLALVAVGVARIVRERDVAADRADRLTLARARLEVERDPAATLATLATLPAGSRYWSAARVIAADAVARGVAEVVPADGAVVAVGLDGDAARVVMRGDGGLRVDGEPAIAGVPSAVVASSDARTIAAIVDGELVVWRRGEVAPRLRRAAPFASPRLAIAADGTAVALAGRDTGVTAWRVAGGDELVRDEAARDVSGLAVASDARLVVLVRAGVVELRGAASRALAVRGEVVAAAVSADGGTVAIATDDGVVRIEPAAGGAAAELRHDAPARGLALGADGAVIATAAGRVVRVWSRAGELRRELRGHASDVTALAVGDDGRVVVSADARGARRWGLADVGARWTGPSADGVRLAVAGDATGGVALACADGAVWRWDGDGAGARVGAHAAAARDLALGPGGLVVTGGDDGTVRAWGDGASRVVGVHRGAVRAVAVDAAGEVVVSGGDDRTVRRWAVTGGGGERVLGRHGARLVAVALSPDGRTVASIADEPVAWLWDAAGEAAPRRLDLPAAASALAVSDGGAIAIGTRAGDVVVAARAGAAPAVVARHDGAVRDLAFARDGRLASAGDDGRVIVVAVGRGGGGVVAALVGHDDLVTSVAWSPHGALASGGEDGTVRLWDVATGEARALRADGWVADVAFISDGAAVVAVGEGGEVWRWRDELPRDAGALRAAVLALVARAPR